MLYIRRATDEDIPWLLEQLQSFSDFYGTKRPLMPSDPEVAAAVIRSLITSTEFFIADLPEVGPVGFIAGVLTPHVFNPELRVLAELLWWVVPAHRGSTTGARLLEHFTQFGRQHAHWVTMTLESASPIDDRVLQKRGFQPHERSLLLEV